MDVVRQCTKGRRWVRLGLLTLFVAAGVGATTFGLTRLEPALAGVDEAGISIGTVRRGTMIRQVRGPGTLVPIDTTWVTARVGGQVLDVPLQAGVEVTPDTILVRLRDPQLERAVTEAERALMGAEADLQQFLLQLQKERLDLKWSIAEARASFTDAKAQAEMDAELALRGLIPRRQREISSNSAQQKQVLLEIQIERAANRQKTNEIEEVQKQALIDRAKDLLKDRTDELASLTIRAGSQGILQQIGPSPITAWQVGQQIPTGAILAKITDPRRLKAVLRVVETQARDVALGQSVAIDTRTRNGVVVGRVERVDPAVQEGTVTVDVALEGELPKGARPDLTVDGIIEIERLEDVLYVDRPAYSQPDTTVSLFRIEANQIARRVPVTFGQCSVYTIEVKDGLREGDRLILTDMSKWDDVERLTIH